MERFLPVAVIVALVGATVAVVVISGGDEESGLGPRQPSVEQQVSPADGLPPGLRELLGRKLDKARADGAPQSLRAVVRSVECGAGRRAPTEIQSLDLPAGVRVGCVIRFRGGRTYLSAKIRDKWGLIGLITHAS